MAGTDTLEAVQGSLVSAGIGQRSSSAQDWMIYRGMMQDSAPGSTSVPTIADRAICLNETPGMEPLQAWAIDYPGVQIIVRGAPDGYSEARDKIQAIFQQLHAQEDALDSAASPPARDIVYFYATQSAPLLMGFDEKRRPRFAWNFRVMRTRVAA